LVSEQEESGRGVTAFRRSWEVPEWQFYYRKRQLKEAKTPPVWKFRCEAQAETFPLIAAIND
jgi:hypothetical protein